MRGERAHLEGGQARQILQVLRLRRGDRILLFDGSGREYEAAIERSTPQGVEVFIVGRKGPLPPSPFFVTLAQGLPKAPKMDLIVQKATELGVDRILPLRCERSVLKEGKLERWRRIAVEAAEQCGRVTVPEIQEVQDLRGYLDGYPGRDQALVLWEGERLQGLKAFLRSIAPARRLTILVGPEGGLSQEEVALAKERGFVAVSLGRRIFRSETAVLVALALIQYEWGDLG